MNEPQHPEIKILRFVVRALAITASTLAIVAFIKEEFQASLTLCFAWGLIVIAEKRMFLSEE